ncbi:CBS domain-containing protein [Streptomyces sp. NBC_01794]|uniref:CBS domain-containing protein n=1 Tax=unclassified Streptomyces TaxID=2593676 RepID=UPI00387335B8
MTTPAITIHANATLPQAARDHGPSADQTAAVVDADGILQGILSRADLLKVFLRPDDDLAAEVRREVGRPPVHGLPTGILVDVTDGVVTLGGTVRDGTLTAAR